MKKTDRANSRSEPGADAAAFRRYLDRLIPRIDRTLEQVLPAAGAKPGIVHRAMRYTALSEGKRLRPCMTVLAYETCGGRGRRADRAAAALEIVHAFSLIHDDLPSMDDDDFRRGKPSNHKVFGEGVAILAGDALLTLAFEILAGEGRARALGPATSLRLVRELGEATGTGGVIGGQVLDLLSEGKKVGRGTLEYIHRHKTARLFTAALRIGALAAEGSPPCLSRLTRYGESLGLAFQVVDDILGAAGTFRELGRDPGRDLARGKVTYPSIMGFNASHRAVDRLLAAARAEADRLPAHRRLFRGLADVVDRRRRDPEGQRLEPKDAS